MLPKLHDTVRGVASTDPVTGRIVVLDAPRSYEFPINASLRYGSVRDEQRRFLVLNKNGLLRVDERASTVRHER
jgi:hypothetical protein